LIWAQKLLHIYYYFFKLYDFSGESASILLHLAAKQAGLWEFSTTRTAPRAPCQRHRRDVDYDNILHHNFGDLGSADPCSSRSAPTQKGLGFLPPCFSKD